MSSISAGKVQVDNLTVQGLGAGAIQATNLKFNNLDVSGNLTLQGAPVATQAFVSSAVSGVIGSAGAALDTLGEIQAALGNDANLASTLTNSIATKANASDVTAGLALKANLVAPTFTGSVNVDSSGSLTVRNMATSINVATAIDNLQQNTLISRSIVDRNAPSSHYGSGFRLTHFSCYNPTTRDDIRDASGYLTALGYPMNKILDSSGYSYHSFWQYPSMSTLNTQAFHNKLWKAMYDEKSDVLVCTGDLGYMDFSPIADESTIDPVKKVFQPLMPSERYWNVFTNDWNTDMWINDTSNCWVNGYNSQKMFDIHKQTQVFQLDRIVSNMSTAGFSQTASTPSSSSPVFMPGVDDHDVTRDKRYGQFPLFIKNAFRDTFISKFNMASKFPELAGLDSSSNRGLWYSKTFPITMDAGNMGGVVGGGQYGIVRVIMLDNLYGIDETTDISISSSQLSWLDATLNEAQYDDFIFIAIGSPIFPRIGDISSNQRSAIMKVIAKYRLEKTVIISGDLHQNGIFYNETDGWCPIAEFMSSGLASGAFGGPTSFGRFQTIDVDFLSKTVNLYEVKVYNDLTRPVSRVLVGRVPFSSLTAKSYIKNKTIKDFSGNNVVIPYSVDTKEKDIVNNVSNLFKLYVTIGGLGVNLSKSTRTVSSVQFISGDVQIPIEVTLTQGQYTCEVAMVQKCIAINKLLSNSANIDASGNHYINFNLLISMKSGENYLTESYRLTENIHTYITVDMNIVDASGNSYRSTIYNNLNTLYTNSIPIRQPTIQQYPSNYMYTITDANKTNSFTRSGNTVALNSMVTDSSGIYYYDQNHTVIIGWGWLDISSYAINLSAKRYTCMFFDTVVHNLGAVPDSVYQYLAVSLLDNASTTITNWNTSLFSNVTGSISAGSGFAHNFYYSNGSARAQTGVSGSGVASSAFGPTIVYREPDVNSFQPSVIGNFYYDWLSSNFDAPGSPGAIGGKPWTTIGLICDSTNNLMYTVIKNTKNNNDNSNVPWCTITQSPLGITGVIKGIFSGSLSAYIGNFRYSQSD